MAVRLRNQKDFQRVRRTGRSWAHPLVVLTVCPNDLPHSRYGIVASKGVGKAVARNRAKRMLREALRTRQSEIETGWDVVLIARQPILGTKLEQVQAAVDNVLQRAQIARQTDA